MLRCNPYTPVLGALLLQPNIVSIFSLFFLYLLASVGVRDENDHPYTPKIVRIGLKPHPSIKAVSMKELVCIWEYSTLNILSLSLSVSLCLALRHKHTHTHNLGELFVAHTCESINTKKRKKSHVVETTRGSL